MGKNILIIVMSLFVGMGVSYSFGNKTEKLQFPGGL